MTTPAKITGATVLKRMADASMSVKDMQQSVQFALIGLMEHAAEHGDKRMLLNDAPGWIKDMSGVNMTALVEWCVKFGGVAIGDGGFVNIKDTPVDMAGALACDWWTLKPMQAFKGMDLTDDLDKLLKKVVNCNKTAAESGDYSKVYAPDEAVDNIKSIHASLVAIREKAERAERLEKAQADIAEHGDDVTGEAPEAPTAQNLDDLDDLGDLQATG